MFHPRLTKEQTNKFEQFINQYVFIDPYKEHRDDDTVFLTSADICRTVDLEPNHSNACLVGNLLKALGHRNWKGYDLKGRGGRFYLVKDVSVS